MVVPSPTDGFPDDLDGYVEPDLYKNHPAAFVPSKVPTRRIPPYMNIFIHEHHITPYIKKVNLMFKLNTLPDQDLDEIEKSLDINIWTVKSENRPYKKFWYLKWKSEFLTLMCFFAGNCDIFALKCFSSKFQDFLWNCIICDVLGFWFIRRKGPASPY